MQVGPGKIEIERGRAMRSRDAEKVERDMRGAILGRGCCGSAASCTEAASDDASGGPAVNDSHYLQVQDT
jgi:hypothetical protein